MEVEIFCVSLVPSSQILAAGATVQILLFAMVDILYFLFKLKYWLFLSVSWQPSSNSMHLMHIHGLKLSVRDGEEQLILFSCSSGTNIVRPSIVIDSQIYPRLATNIIVSSMLVLGGSATVTDLTGMNTIAVSTLIVSSCSCLVGSCRLVFSFHLASPSTW